MKVKALKDCYAGASLRAAGDVFEIKGYYEKLPKCLVSMEPPAEPAPKPVAPRATPKVEPGGVA